MRKLAGLLLAVSVLRASPDVAERARALYLKTNYQASLKLLEQDPSPDAATFELAGKNYFMLDSYDKAVQYFEKAAALEPMVSDHRLWLGRAWGKRAETEGWFTAGSRATKARQNFEMAIALNPKNNEALNDLFDFYLNAPGFLGGGAEKAEAIARRIEHDRPAEYQHELALLADHRKQHEDAVAHLRKAVELAPDQVGRVLDLARYLAKVGRMEESEAEFEMAWQRWPGDPRVAFAHAKFYVDHHREPARAREYLEMYLKADVGPEDPPKQAAEKMLRQVASR